MIKIIKLTAAQVSPLFITLTWYLEPTTESLTDYHVDIYKSELPSTNISDYDIVTSGISPQSYNSYNDTSVGGLTNKFDTYNYIIKVIHNVSGATTTSTPVSVNVESDKYARYMVRWHRMVLERHSGAEFILLHRKTYGTYCTSCYDETLQRTTNSKCPVCYDTSYVGGYYSPHRFLGQMNNNPPRHQLTTYGDWQDNDAILSMGNDPVIVPGDVIVDRLGKRWIVITIKSTNKALFLIGQQLHLRQIETDNIVYSYPITW